MKARTLTFYVDPERIAEVLRVLDEEILPRYRAMPNFVSLVLLHADYASRELLGLSVWDGDLAGSEEIMASFRQRLTSIAGIAPTAGTYDVLRVAFGRSG